SENTDADLAGREGMNDAPEDGGGDTAANPAMSPDSGVSSNRTGGYEFASVVTLINNGFIVSSDATTWRLHNAADGSIAYEITVAELEASGDHAFTAIVDKDGNVYWQAGIDSAEQLIKANNLTDDDTILTVTVVPDNEKTYPYLYPDLPWKLVISDDPPSWYGRTHEKAVMVAFEKWKTYVYDFDLTGFRDFFAHLPVEPVTPTDADIALLKEWATLNPDGQSVDAVPDTNEKWVGKTIWSSAEAYLNDAFSEAYGQCPGPVVCHGIEVATSTTLDAATEDKIGSTVGEKALVGSFFTNTEKWKGIAAGTTGYPWQACVSLWKRGFIASSDGTNWRLSSGKEGTVVYTASATDLLK
ncbi:MAG: hypothetical protein LBJ07_02675, partial [Actinomycetes bacterium]|nr:hypothetical protein [Actinomycetes bacterium]